jgi:peroxiredoxin
MSTMPGSTGAEGGGLGDAAPDFELEGSSGRIRLSDYRPGRNVAVFFMREFG